MTWTTRAARVAGLVLPSFEDEAVHFRRPCHAGRPRQNAIWRVGARLVVVKNGEGPLVVRASDGDGFQFQPEPVASVVDTTAAGDSFNAAFLVDYSGTGAGPGGRACRLFACRTCDRQPRCAGTGVPA